MSALIRFFYPVPNRTAYSALNFNVLISGSKSEPVMLDGAKTRELRRLMSEANNHREWLRWEILRYKTQAFVACAFANLDQPAVYRDFFMQSIEEFNAREISMLSTSHQATFHKDSAQAVYAHWRAHQSVLRAAKQYAESMDNLTAFVQREESNITRWCCVRGEDELITHARTREEVLPLRVRTCHPLYTQTPSRAWVNGSGWLGSSTLAHKQSNYIVDTALAYDHAMAHAVVTLACLNTAELLGALSDAIHARVPQNKQMERVCCPANIAARFQSAKTYAERTRTIVETWHAKPCSNALVAELQPFVLQSLGCYAQARSVYFKHKLHRTLAPPDGMILTRELLQCGHNDDDDNFPETLSESVYHAESLRALMIYNAYLSQAFTHYGNQKLEKTEFACFLHAMMSSTLARCVYTEAMIRIIQCSNSLTEIPLTQRHAALRKILDPCTRRVNFLKDKINHECNCVQTWNLQTKDHAYESSLSSYGTPRHPDAAGHVFSSICLPLLYTQCKNMWDMLHKWTMYADVVSKHAC